MKHRRREPVCWHWLAGYLLGAEVEQLGPWRWSDDDLERRYHRELAKLPTLQQTRLSERDLTEETIAAMPATHCAIMRRLLRRTCQVLDRQQAGTRV